MQLLFLNQLIHHIFRRPAAVMKRLEPIRFAKIFAFECGLTGMVHKKDSLIARLVFVDDDCNAFSFQAFLESLPIRSPARQRPFDGGRQTLARSLPKGLIQFEFLFQVLKRRLQQESAGF